MFKIPLYFYYFLFLSVALSHGMIPSTAPAYLSKKNLENEKKDYERYLDDRSMQLEKIPQSRLVEELTYLGYTPHEAYGALAARSFFVNEYEKWIPEHFLSGDTLNEINELLHLYTTQVKNAHAGESIEKKIQLFNKVLHAHNCARLGYDPEKFTTKDLADLVVNNQINKQLHTHLMGCSQFVTYLIEKMAKK